MSACLAFVEAVPRRACFALVVASALQAASSRMRPLLQGRRALGQAQLTSRSATKWAARATF
jgi:hypothetical protein